MGRLRQIKGGYDVNLDLVFKKDKPKPISKSGLEEYRCFICRLLLRQPQQFSCCGIRCCRGCVEDLHSQLGRVFTCRQCNEKVGDGSNDMEYVFPDQSCVNDMKNFYTVCNTKPVSCKWMGPLFELEQHYEQCEYVEIQCTMQCGMIMKRSQLVQHLKTDCTMRVIECNFCQMQVQVVLLQLREHVHGGQCAEALLTCPLREALNCISRVKPAQLLQHTVLHIKDVIQNNQSDKDQLQRQNITLQRDLADALEKQNARMKEYDARIEEYEQKILMLEDHLRRHNEEIVNLSDNVSRIGSAPAAKPYGVHTSDLTHFEGNIRSLQNSFDVLARQIDALNEKVEENTETVGTLQTAMDQCTKAITQVNGMVNEVGLKVDILAVRSINGILIWKVNEVEKRIEEAKTGKILSLYSPPFFTSLHGYRMCLRLYLDGDGQGKGSHVSLFLVIMKSDYDDLLTWPFKQKVTLYLLNQQDPYNTKAHIAQAFRPTETSTSFQKPRGPFNTASGFPKFAPVEKLRDRNFVQDDCMYFKVKIDMTDVKAPDYPAY